MFEKRVAKAYRRELFGSMFLYTVLLFASIHFGRPMADGTARTIVLLTPMLGFGLALWAMARHLGRIDEYMRKATLESVALAAGITAGLTFTYGFLETAGFPKLSMFSVWLVMAGSLAVITLVRCALKR